MYQLRPAKKATATIDQTVMRVVVVLRASSATVVGSATAR